jgi:hypothetical protein
MKRLLFVLLGIPIAAVVTLSVPAWAEQPLAIKLLAEKRVPNLPAGDLYWRLENFDSLAQASAAAGPWALAAVAGGKAWLFTLGPAGGVSPGGVKVVEFGPIPRATAQQYLLRVNEASGPPGSTTPVHTHPGSEAFFVLAGEQSIRSPRGVLRVKVGQPEVGNGADSAMQVSSSGSTDLTLW